MAKSKAVKQTEALERKRKLYPQKLDLSARSRFGGDLYDAVLVRSGKDAADENNKRAQLAFSKYLHEAQLDSHGNPGKPPAKIRADMVKVAEESLLDDAEKAVDEKMGLGASILKSFGTDGRAMHKHPDIGVSIEPYHQTE